MKHIKKFEINDISDDEIQKYRKNDYVKLKSSGFVDKLPRYAKITSIDPPTLNSCIYYFCVTPDNNKLWMPDDRIERELDKYEIEKYEFDLIANKFNL